jgi:D-alanyl-D-alanine carboxypeptidase
VKKYFFGILSLIVSTASASPPPSIMQVEAAIDAAKFSGDVLASKGDEPISISTARPFGGLWRWASVTKQVVATLVMQEVAKGSIDLDKPVSTYLPNFKSPNAAKITVRQLLRHQSGLPNPDDTAATPDALAAYYAPDYKGSRDPLSGYCAGPVKGEPGGNWAYNNCDYIVAGALLKAVTGKPWQTLVQERVAKPLKLKTLAAFPSKVVTMPGRIDGKPEPAIQFESFGAAAGLYGSARDLWRFDRALMTGKLLPEKQRAEMWDGQPQLGFIALGQWAFEAPLKGCAKPVRIVERRGAVGGVQVRNFDFGEVWQGSGFSHDLLAAAACAS